MMIEAGVCREQASGLLPQNMYTEYYGTANLNNILKFVDLRTPRRCSMGNTTNSSELY
jgi:thymidylate synthase ThyX